MWMGWFGRRWRRPITSFCPMNLPNSPHPHVQPMWIIKPHWPALGCWMRFWLKPSRHYLQRVILCILTRWGKHQVGSRCSRRTFNHPFIANEIHIITLPQNHKKLFTLIFTGSGFSYGYFIFFFFLLSFPCFKLVVTARWVKEWRRRVIFGLCWGGVMNWEEARCMNTKSDVHRTPYYCS